MNARQWTNITQDPRVTSAVNVTVRLSDGTLLTGTFEANADKELIEVTELNGTVWLIGFDAVLAIAPTPATA